MNTHLSLLVQEFDNTLLPSLSRLLGEERNLKQLSSGAEDAAPALHEPTLTFQFDKQPPRIETVHVELIPNYLIVNLTFLECESESGQRPFVQFARPNPAEVVNDLRVHQSMTRK